MMLSVVLMIGLCFVKGFECNHLGDNRPLENFGFIKLSDISVANALLLWVAVKDSRTILRARVGSLPIKLGGIVGDSKIHLEKLTVRNPGRIIFDPDRLSMPGITFADHLVVGCVSGSSRVACAN